MGSAASAGQSLGTKPSSSPIALRTSTRSAGRRCRKTFPRPTRILPGAKSQLRPERELAFAIVVRKTLARLCAQGLDRHEAVHAIGNVLVMHIYDVLNDPEAGAEPNEAYERELEQLTAEKWRRGRS